MTKRKPQDQLQRRGRKPGPDQDGMTWLAVEVRRDLGTVGRARGTVSRALQFLAQDLEKAGTPVPIKTMRNRYYRAAARRKSEPAYAALLDYWQDYNKQRLNDIQDGSRKSTLLAVRPAVLGKTPN